MKLVRPHHIPVLLLGIGLLLLLNPLYAFSGGGVAPTSPTYQYGIEEIEGEDNVSVALQFAHNAHVCPGVRTCLGEEQIAEEGSITVEHASFDSQRGFDVIWIDGQYYKPTVERDESGNHRLSHEELTLEEALSEASLSSENVDSEIRSGIRWGVVGSNEPIPPLEKHLIIEHDGTYYQSRTAFRSSYHIFIVRTVGFGLGIFSIRAGYQRYLNIISDENETDTGRS